MIKVIAFDLWNTLIGSTMDFPYLISLSKKDDWSLGEYIAKYENALHKKSFSSFQELKNAFFKELKETENELLEKALYDIYSSRVDKIVFFPDVEDNLLKLKKQGYPLVLVSNVENLAFDDVNKVLDLNKYFDYFCLSFEVGAIKPDKKMFDCILKKTRVLPSEVLMVGDSLRSDIIGAKKAKMHNCWINRPNKSYDLAKVVPEFEIKSFNELPKVLNKLNGVK
ncbi:MAG: HAD family hydrolase [Candidatus Diapherotrites archaeon]|uniref:HAD family hydrolase n=1 Tax=Candidatus Iainarchaeum sp. TaxID=3101447 RepID=A0A7K4BYT2_9ARCH|nr:HAD family hydrolase [Candidatus Diapherotrites archaeon]